VIGFTTYGGIAHFECGGLVRQNTELHNLELSTEAVNAKLAQNAQFAPNLAIPFRVIGGMFEQFQVDVPWAKLTSKVNNHYFLSCSSFFVPWLPR
jgi:hypothetical protein